MTQRPNIISKGSMEIRKKLALIKKYIPAYYMIYTKEQHKWSNAQKAKILDKFYNVALKHVKRVQVRAKGLEAGKISTADKQKLSFIKRNIPSLYSKWVSLPTSKKAKALDDFYRQATIQTGKRAEAKARAVAEARERIPEQRPVLPVQNMVTRPVNNAQEQGQSTVLPVQNLIRKPVNNTQEIEPNYGGGNMATYRKPTLQEKIKDWIYDSYVPTVGTDATFFSTPIGGTKTLTQTNMTQGGQLPFSEKFRVIGLGAYVTPLVKQDVASNTDLLDYISKIQEGNWSLKIMNKTYLQGAISSILSQNRVEAKITQAAAADGAVVTMDAPFYKTYGYFPVTGGEFTLNNGVNFSVTVNWDASVGAANMFRLYIVIFGLRYRPIQ